MERGDRTASNEKKIHFTMNSCLPQTFPMGEDSKFRSTVNWSTREINLLDHKDFLVLFS